MKYRIIAFCIISTQLSYGQILSKTKVRLNTLLSAPNNWHSVVMMEDMNIEGENGMTWRNTSENYLIDIEFEANGASDLGVKVLLKPTINQEAIVGYNLTNEQLYINTFNAGQPEPPYVNGIATATMTIVRGRIKLQIFVSKTSIEVFANDGEATVFSKVFPKENSTDWQIFSEGKAKIAKLSVFEKKD
jgi:sucrose-6-phosphate hydrolase SacC (GH32 family)